MEVVAVAPHRSFVHYWLCAPQDTPREAVDRQRDLMRRLVEPPLARQ